jgi:hypothetical protein
MSSINFSKKQIFFIFENLTLVLLNVKPENHIEKTDLPEYKRQGLLQFG